MIRREINENANLLGLGVVKGKWFAEDIHKFIEKFLTLKPNQKPFVMRMHKIPNFCTLTLGSGKKPKYHTMSLSITQSGAGNSYKK